MHFYNCGWGAAEIEKDELEKTIFERMGEKPHEMEYNCGGFALNSLTWYHPSENQDLYEEWCCELYDHIDEMVAQILKDFPNARLIGSLEELQKEEIPVAFRVREDDFHFIKRDKDNVWRHKQGSWGVEELLEEDVFSESWSFGYDSEITWFALKEACA